MRYNETAQCTKDARTGSRVPRVCTNYTFDVRCLCIGQTCYQLE